jgi:hypothetical protein
LKKCFNYKEVAPEVADYPSELEGGAQSLEVNGNCGFCALGEGASDYEREEGGVLRNLGKAVVLSALVLFVGGAMGCGTVGGGEGGSSGAEMRVAATTSVIRDLAEQVGGERVEVTSIVPVGGSPETFQPSPRDAARISESEVVFENGLGLDDWVEDLVESAGGEDQTVIELTDGLEPLEGGEHGEEEGAAEEEHGEEHAGGIRTSGSMSGTLGSTSRRFGTRSWRRIQTGPRSTRLTPVNTWRRSKNSTGT